MQTNPYHENVKKHLFSNGFEVFYIEKPGFKQKFSGVMINYGGADQPQNFELPSGTAHFLEHQLFAKPYGDITDKFEKYDATSNAFTSYNETMYFANFTENSLENVKTLVELVANPYFTKENVDTEREIIRQELTMYQDIPDWQLNNQIMHQLYGQSSLSQEVVGSNQSLDLITAETLQKAYNYYYTAKNMKLVVVGDLDFDNLLKGIEEEVGKLSNGDFPVLQSESKEMTYHVQHQIMTVKGKIESPKFAIGIKFDEKQFSQNRQQLYITLQILFESLFGLSSTFYEELQDLQLINGEIDFDINFNRQGDFVLITGSSYHPKQTIQKIIDNINQEKVSESVFNRQKRKLFGQEIRQMDDFESYGIEFVESIFDEEDYYQYYTDIQTVDYDTVQTLFDEFRQGALYQSAILVNED